MKKLFFLTLCMFSSAQAIGPKPLTIAISIDMTGAQNVAGYQKTARLVLESLVARDLKTNDTLTIYKVCGFASTLESVKLPKETKRQRIDRAINIAARAVKPCTDKGSSITKALKMMTGNQVNIIFTDGGLSNDPDGKNFKKAAAQLLTSNTKAVWFGGLSNQRTGDTSLRDSLAAQLPKDSRVIVSGLNDAQSGFSQLAQLMKKARR